MHRPNEILLMLQASEGATENRSSFRATGQGHDRGEPVVWLPHSRLVAKLQQ